MNVGAILVALLDNPALQEPIAMAIAQLLVKNLPGAVNKDLSDLLQRVSIHLLDPAVVPVVPPKP